MVEGTLRDVAGFRIRGVEVNNELHVSVVDICQILGFKNRYIPSDFRSKGIKVKGFYTVLPWSALHNLVCARKWKEGVEYNQRVIRFIKTNERYSGTPLAYSDGEEFNTPLESMPEPVSPLAEEIQEPVLTREETCVIAQALKLLREVSGAKKVTFTVEF